MTCTTDHGCIRMYSPRPGETDRGCCLGSQDLLLLSGERVPRTGRVRSVRDGHREVKRLTSGGTGGSLLSWTPDAGEQDGLGGGISEVRPRVR